MIRYPNTRVRISKHVCLKINFQKNTVLEQMFINKWPVLSSVFSCLETLMKHSPSFINKLQNRKFFARNFIHSLLFPLESHSFVVLMHFCNVGMASIKWCLVRGLQIKKPWLCFVLLYMKWLESERETRDLIEGFPYFLSSLLASSQFFLLVLWWRKHWFRHAFVKIFPN